jgi:YD repeat-containing protein
VPKLCQNPVQPGLNHSQQTLTAAGWTQPYPFIYTYNARGLIGEQYPSTRVVNTSYDGAGRVSLVSSGVTNYATLTTTPASSIFAYAPHGAIRQINLGNGLFETATYNSRLQTTAIRLGSTAGSSSVAAFFPYYCPSSGTGCATNNGNVFSADIFPLGARDTHTYDAANRVISASEGSAWSQNYVYDAFGNRAVLGASGAYIPNPGFTPQVPTLTSLPPYTNNRWNGATHDAVGNVHVLNGFTYSYDAENRQTKSVQVVGSNSITSTYSYDGEGRRVTRVAGGVTTVYV